MQYRSLLLVLLLAAAASAEPVAKIIGPTEGEPGNLVILRTDGTIGSGHEWLIIPEEAKAHFLPIKDSGGRQAAVFAYNKPVTVTFILAVAEGDRVALAVHVLRQGDDPGPGPGPGPDPPDPPDPPEPDVANDVAIVIVEDTISSEQAETIARLREHCGADQNLRCIVLDTGTRDENGRRVAQKYVDAAGISPPFAMGFLDGAQVWAMPLGDTAAPIIEKLE